MGNEWDSPEDNDPRPTKWLVAILIVLAIILGIAWWHGAQTGPPVPPDRGRQAVTSPVQPSPTPTHTPELPTQLPTRFYVVSKDVPSYWELNKVLTAWQVAKYSELRLVGQCPHTADPCVTVRMGKLPSDTAAQATFNYNLRYLTIDLNPLVISHAEAESTLAHEFGHLLGAPHIIKTFDTVMSPIGVYRLLPTKLDIQTVDRLGPWELQKMYKSSGKTLDMAAGSK